MNLFRFLFLFCIIILISSLKAQNSEADSLKQLLATADAKQKVFIYNRLAKIDSRNDPQKRIDYGTKALSLAKKHHLKVDEIYALMSIGIGYSLLSDNNEAVKFHQQALTLAGKIHNKKLAGKIHNELGIDYKYLGKYDKALEHFIKYISIFEEIEQENDDKAILLSIAHGLNNIGVIYDEMGEYDKALEYYNQVLEIRNTMNDLNGKALVYNNIGIVFEEKGKYREALRYYNQALEIRKKIGNKRSLSRVLLNIGIVYLDMGDYDKALDYHLKAQKALQRTNDTYSLANVSNSIADIYLEKEEPEKAFPYITEAIQLAKQTDAKRILHDAYKFLAKYYMQTNDYRKAYEAQSQMLALNDSLFNLDLAQQVADMQTKYETEKKEKEIEIQKLKIKKQTLGLYLLIGFVLFVATIFLFIFGRFRLKQKNARIELERKNLETEKRLLRSQMNPHFIFNSMNSIQSYISGNDTFLAMTYLSKFAQLMRSILENSRKSLISLSEEISTLQLYIELEKIRFNNKFDFQFNIEPDLPTEIIYVPPMMIQPFVENAIKHGLQHKNENGLLQIAFSKDGQTIRCVVADNGIGREKAAVKNGGDAAHHSLGIQVTKERFEAIKKQKGVDVNFEIIDLTDDAGNPAGTRVIINLPFETEE